MAYTKLTDFAVKDALLTGNPAKVVRGTEIDAELNAIAAADALNLSAASIVAATSKTTPIDADLIPLVDSAASNVLKKLTWANLKATLLTWLQGTVLPSPGPIGSTTPSTGAFTTLSATGKYQISGSGSVPTASLLEIGTNGVGSRWLYNAPAGGEHNFNVNGSTIAYVNAAGVGVTGALSATGNIDFGSGTTLSAYMDVAKPNAGGTVDVGIHNSDNTNVNSHAQLRIYSGGASGGDPIINLEVSGVSTRRYIGIDNSNSDLFVIGRGYSPGVADDLTIDASGNLGLGVTPSAWSGFKAIDLGATSSFYHNSGNNSIGVGSNLYYNGSNWIYKVTAPASLYTQIAGIHSWFNAVSGTAGTSFSLVQQMSLDANGNLGVGVTPSAWSGAKAIELQGGSIMSSNTGNIATAQNAYFDGATWVYKITAVATIYQSTGGTHQLYSAASGTAGTPITWTQTLSVGKGTTLALEGATSAAGTGIAFPATQLASSNANTLDDYEYGSFTATIDGTTTAGTGTYTTQVGRYKKIGRLVQFQLNLVWSSHTGTGNLKVSGLPFTTGSTANSFTAVSIYNAGIAMTAGSVMQAYTNVSGTTIVLEQVPTGGGSSTAIPVDTAGQIILTGTYEAA